MNQVGNFLVQVKDSKNARFFFFFFEYLAKLGILSWLMYVKIAFGLPTR